MAHGPRSRPGRRRQAGQVDIVGGLLILLGAFLFCVVIEALALLLGFPPVAP